MDSSAERSKWMKIAISTLVFVVLAVCPEFGPMTRAEMYALAGFVAAIVSWMLGVDAWYSVAIMIVYSILMGSSFGDVEFPAMMGSGTVWLVFSMFWFIAAIRDSGLFKYLASKFMSIGIAKKGPYWLMSMFLIACYLTSAITQAQMAVTVFLFALLKQVSEAMGLKKYNMWTVATGIGIGVVGCVGALLFPFNWVTQLYFSLFASTLGVQNFPNDLAYTLMMLVTGILVMAFIVLFTKFILRPKMDLEKLKELDLTSDIRINKTMVGTIIAILALVLALVLPTTLPAEWAFTQAVGKLGTTGGFLLAAIIQCFVRDPNGEPLFNFGKKLKDSAEISLLLSLGPVLYLGNIVNSTTGGLTAIFQELFAPLGNLNPILMVSILGLICVLMTNVTNNFLPCFICGPIGLAVLGYDTKWAAILCLVLLLNAFTAVAFPSASSVGILLHGEKEMFQTKQVVIWGYVFGVLAWLAGTIAMLVCMGIF